MAKPKRQRKPRPTRTAKKESEHPWGVAAEKRGVENTELALAFIKAFPIGTEFKTEDFDKWAMANGHMPKITGDTDAAKALRSRERGKVLAHIARASTHPRLRNEHRSTPFSCDFLGNELWVNREPVAAVEHINTARVLKTHAARIRTRIRHLCQGAPFDQLDPRQQALLEVWFEDATIAVIEFDQRAKRLDDRRRKILRIAKAQ
jgi:hypothetical protein